MEKNKTLWCILVCFILLLLVFSLVTYKADTETVLTYSVDSNEFSTLEKSGYSESIDEKTGVVTYTVTNNDPWTHIPFPEKCSADYIIIDFESPIDRNTEISVYFSPDGSAYNSKNVYSHRYAIDYSGTLTTIFVQNLECISVRLDMDCTFAINSISFYNVETTSFGEYSLNLRVLFLLILLVALLIVFEKRIGFFDWLKSTALEELNYVKELFGSSKFVILTVHLLTRLFALASLVTISTIFFRSAINKNQIYVTFALLCATIASTVIDKILTRKYTSPARMFFVTVILLGLMLILCLPYTSYNVPDEEIHYNMATSLKTLLFGGKISLADLKMGWRYYINSSFLENPLSESLYFAVDDSVLFDIAPRGINLYNAIGYLPAAILMAFSDLLAISYAQSFLIIKFANLLIYAFIISMAIRRLKSGGYIFSTICLMPSSIILACSFSYDCWVMTFLTFGIAYFISELQQPDKKLRIQDCIFMLGSMFIGCGPKAVYFVLMLPLLFISKNKFETKKQHKIYITACLATMVTILLSFVLPFVIDTSGASDIRGGSDVNASEQLKFILKNPFEYVKILFNFISYYLSFENMSNNIIAHTYLGAPLTVYATVMIFIIMFATFTDKSEYDAFSNRHLIKSMGVVSCVGALLLVVTALYISFTPVAHTTVNGVQFRYVFPIMPMFFYCLGPASVHSRIDKRITETFVFGVTSVILMCSVYEYSITKLISLI